MSHSKILLILFLIFGILFFSNQVFAYDDKTTHPALTDEIVDFYNLSFPNKQLTSQQKEWIVEGSILEDTPPRWINHFYDPVNKVGWTGEKAGSVPISFVQIFSRFALSQEKPLSAVEWANNIVIQQMYSSYGGNRTWKKALEYYADGNQEQAYKTLGYVLHLLEDQSVPDHTRNDTHAQEVSAATGDEGSPYEQYAANKYNRQTIKKLNISNNLKKENKSPIIQPSIEDYLISLADYSNKYFFSKDTINDKKYQNPKIVRDDGEFGYGIDENGREFPLVRARILLDDYGKIKTEYFLNTDKEKEILSAYFSRLSHQAVLHGAGVINLFRKQAQDELVNKEYPTHLVKYDWSKIKIPGVTTIVSIVGTGYKIINTAKSFFAQASATLGNAFSSIKDSVSSVFKNDQNFQLAGQVSLNQTSKTQDVNIPASDVQKPQSNIQVDTKPQQQLSVLRQSASQEEDEENQPLQKKKTEQPEIQKQLSQPTSTPQQATTQQATNFKQCNFATSQSPSHLKIIINEVAWMGTSASANDEWIELKNISGGEIDLTGWQLIDLKEDIKIILGTEDKRGIINKKIKANGFYLYGTHR